MGGVLHLIQRGGDGRGRSRLRPLLAVLSITAHPSTASVPGYPYTFPSFPLPFSSLSSSLFPFPVTSLPPQIQLGGLGSAVSSPAGSGAEPRPQMHF